MIEIVKVIKVRATGGYRVHLTFSNGDAGVRDFSDVIADGGPMVEPLKDPAYFARVFVQSGVPAWPNGFDVDAIALHAEMAQAGLLSREPTAVG